jgi:hypothetical protein
VSTWSKQGFSVVSIQNSIWTFEDFHNEKVLYMLGKTNFKILFCKRPEYKAGVRKSNNSYFFVWKRERKAPE